MDYTGAIPPTATTALFFNEGIDSSQPQMQPFPAQAMSLFAPPPSDALTVFLSPAGSNPTGQRAILVKAGEPVLIGRASKSTDRKLQARMNNALFDCPVVSRQHAHLKYHPNKPINQRVTITDLGSMHGTYVNDCVVHKNTPYILHEGDTIKLGDCVIRGPERHDGLVLRFTTFDPLGRHFTNSGPPPALPIEQHSPARDPESLSNAGFHVPSDSDDDNVSDQDDNVPPQSSFTYNPGLTSLSRPGTQEQPIELDNPEVIELEDDEDDVDHAVAAASQKVVKDTYGDDDIHSDAASEDSHYSYSSYASYGNANSDGRSDIESIHDGSEASYASDQHGSDDHFDMEKPEIMSSKSPDATAGSYYSEASDFNNGPPMANESQPQAPPPHHAAPGQSSGSAFLNHDTVQSLPREHLSHDSIGMRFNIEPENQSNTNLSKKRPRWDLPPPTSLLTNVEAPWNESINKIKISDLVENNSITNFAPSYILTEPVPSVGTKRKAEAISTDSIQEVLTEEEWTALYRDLSSLSQNKLEQLKIKAAELKASAPTKAAPPVATVAVEAREVKKAKLISDGVKGFVGGSMFGGLAGGAGVMAFLLSSYAEKLLG